MGFSPGDFNTQNGNEYHWELKDGPRIVLWDQFEAKQPLSLSFEEALKAYQQLRTLLLMVDPESV